MRSCLFLLLLLLLATISLQSQNVNPNYPPEIQVQKHPTPDDMRARVSNFQLQKDAKELADLCASVPADIDAVKRSSVEGRSGKIEARRKAFQTCARTVDPNFHQSLDEVCEMQ